MPQQTNVKVYLMDALPPYWSTFAGSPAALDFAITAPQRQETLAQAGRHPAAAAEAYARHKEQHLQTLDACASHGVKFVVMVAECTGAWGHTAMTILKHIAFAAATQMGAEPAVCYNDFLQELGVSIRSFRAPAAPSGSGLARFASAFLSCC